MKDRAGKQPAERITREEAIKKAGIYAAFTAAAAIIILAPKTAQAGTGPVFMGTGFNHNRGSGPGPLDPPAGGINNRLNSPFDKPAPAPSSAGLRKSPWK